MEDNKKPLFPKYQWTWKKFFDSYIWLALLLFIVDIVSKWVVQLTCPLDTRITVIPNFFYITLSYNQGAVFGIGQGTLWARIIFIIISWVMSFVIFFYWRKHLNKEDHLINAILMLVFTGAVGNLIDRTFYWNSSFNLGSGLINAQSPGGVIDFLQFYLGGGPSAGYNSFNPFATFNIADSCITVGIVMLLIVILVRSIKSHGEDEDDPREEEEKIEDGKDHK
jgi:signal peptidase II